MPLCGFNEKMIAGLTDFMCGLCDGLSLKESVEKNTGEHMALCGFNEKMIEGLRKFDEGLVEHGLQYRSKKNDETIDQGIKRELADMARLLLELHRIDDAAKRTITEGIVKYAMGFYLIMRQTDVGKYKQVIERINEYSSRWTRNTTANLKDVRMT